MPSRKADFLGESLGGILPHPPLLAVRVEYVMPLSVFSFGHSSSRDSSSLTKPRVHFDGWMEEEY